MSTDREQIFRRLILPISLLLLAPGLSLPPHRYDEGLIVYNAGLVLDGAVPYRDFWTLYAPGQYYAVALLFSLFGENLIVVRLYDLVIRALLACTVYLVCRQAASHYAACAAWLLALLFLALVNVFGYPMFPALLLALLAGQYAAGSDSSPRSACWGGALGFCALFFRQDVGLYLTAAVIGHLLAVRRAQAAALIGMFFAGFLAVAVPVAIYFLWRVPGALLFDQLVHFPLAVFPQSRSLPFPQLEPSFLVLVIYGPCAVLLAAAAVGLFVGRDRGAVSSRRLLWVALLGIFAFFHLRIRPDLIHALPGFLISSMIVPALAADLFNRKQPVPRILSGVCLCYMVLLVGATTLRFSGIVEWSLKMLESGSGGHGPVRARAVPLREDQAAVAGIVQTRTAPGQRILVIPDGPVEAVYPDLLLYFLTDRQAPSRYAELHPGLGKEADRDLASQVVSAEVPLVVLHGGDERQRPATEAGVLPSGSPLPASPLQDFPVLRQTLDSRFEVTAQVGSYKILEPRRRLKAS